MKIETPEQLIHAMQSSQFSMEEKKEILIEYFRLMGYNQSTNNKKD